MKKRNIGKAGSAKVTPMPSPKAAPVVEAAAAPAPDQSTAAIPPTPPKLTPPDSAPLSQAAFVRLNDALGEQAAAVSAAESAFAEEVGAALKKRNKARAEAQALVTKRVTREADELGIPIPEGGWGFRLAQGSDERPLLQIQRRQ